MKVPPVATSEPTLPEPISDHDRVVRAVSNSALFTKAPVLRQLLLYLWEHHDGELSEYAIGVDVLGRREDFNPKNDATVRAQVSRLRGRLREYYDGEGKESAYRVLIPMGAHRISVVELPVDAPALPTESAVVEQTKPISLRWRTILPVALAAVSILLLVDDLHLRLNPPEVKAASVPAFWQPLIEGHNSFNLIVPAPIFLRWQGVPFVARDFRVNNPEAVPDSPILRMLVDKYGKPEMSQLYTVASDTIATSHLVKFLQERGVRSSIVDSPSISLELLESANSVVLVGTGTVAQLDEALRATNFRFGAEPSKGSISNEHPMPGEPATWTSVQHAPLRFTTYGVVARLPGRSGQRTTLLLASDHNQNLAEILTTSSELQKIEALRAANGSPKYFELVIRMETNGDNTLRSTPVAFRAVTAK